ncbi:MAG TPA: ATP-binding protein [Urbifossiella sp.]|nr:ATP-binding protein [Urbifossiella sp.]
MSKRGDRRRKNRSRNRSSGLVENNQSEATLPPSDNRKPSAFEAMLHAHLNQLRQQHSELKLLLTVDRHARNYLNQIDYSSQLAIATTELIVNAAMAMRYAGRIEIRVIALSNNNIVRISVRDNGPGLPYDVQGHAFGDAFLLPRPGKGLGLSLVATLVKSAGGTMRAINKDGATIELDIPIINPQPTAVLL